MLVPDLAYATLCVHIVIMVTFCHHFATGDGVVFWGYDYTWLLAV